MYSEKYGSLCSYVESRKIVASDELIYDQNCEVMDQIPLLAKSLYIRKGFVFVLVLALYLAITCNF